SSSWLLLPSSVSRPFFSKQQPLDPPRKSPPSGEPHRFRPATALRAEADARRRRKPCPLQSGEMLGEFFSRVLLLLFGYAMPAFECFKTVEARPNDAHMLRFWCQYWMPMYGEIKLAFFVYLWYPKTKGSDIVYDTFLRPMVMQYEPNIEQRLLHLRARSGQLLTFYIQNFADKGTAFFMDVLRYVVSDEPAASVSERNRKSSGWSPFATKRRPPSPPPQESIFGGPADLDAAAVAQVIRASMAGAKPARRQYSGKY
uniref:HVA22-like protein n=3 Tax=Triticinae TaxID=1648030 RepID=A0A453HND9_AEGTS